MVIRHHTAHTLIILHPNLFNIRLSFGAKEK